MYSTDPCVRQVLKDLDHVDDGALNLRHAWNQIPFPEKFKLIKFTYMYFSCLKRENNSGSASTDVFTIDGLPSLINVHVQKTNTVME